MSYMFYKSGGGGSYSNPDSTKFDQNLTAWNVSQVTDMSYMFYGCRFNQALDKWDVGKVTDMSYMFYMAYEFNQNLNSWNVGKVTDMSYMFYMAYEFNQNLNSWHVGKVTDMYGMFYGAGKFNQNLNSWNIGKVANTSYMFYGAYKFNQDLCRWGEIQTFPYDNANNMFLGSGCNYLGNPQEANKGPFCASQCGPVYNDDVGPTRQLTDATCGLGNVGNGICPIPNACCSQQGWCGFGKDYCDDYQNMIDKTKVETITMADPMTVAVPRPMKGTIQRRTPIQRRTQMRKKNPIHWFTGNNHCPTPGIWHIFMHEKIKNRLDVQPF